MFTLSKFRPNFKQTATQIIPSMSYREKCAFEYAKSPDECTAGCMDNGRHHTIMALLYKGCGFLSTLCPKFQVVRASS